MAKNYPPVQGGYDYQTENSIQYYHANYVRNAKAIAVLWGIFTICFAVINIVAFVEPHWIGRSDEGGFGHFGLFQYCAPVLAEGGLDFQIRCFGSLADFSSILNPAFRASTVFIGLSFLITLLVICSWMLFCWVHPRTVFILGGCMQAVCALCMFLGVVIYPSGWTHETVQRTCGDSATAYYAGECGIRWAMALAIVAIIDAIVLAALAFMLGTKYITAGELGIKSSDALSVYKGDVNSVYQPGPQPAYDGVSVMSKKSMNLQPIVAPPGADYDRYSHVSRPRSQAHYNRQDFSL